MYINREYRLSLREQRARSGDTVWFLLAAPSISKDTSRATVYFLESGMSWPNEWQIAEIAKKLRAGRAFAIKVKSLADATALLHRFSSDSENAIGAA